MAAIGKLMDREKQLRRDVLSGAIDGNDPRWLENRGVSKVYAREGKA
jgi:hypothetical protein